MRLLLCKGKIHRATVTEANLHYKGSITIDSLLMEKAHILPYEMVQINGLKDGETWKTYAIPAPKGSGTICLNGSPANLFERGDIIVILSIGQFDEFELHRFKHCVVFVDPKNQITSTSEHKLTIDSDGNKDSGI